MEIRKLSLGQENKACEHAQERNLVKIFKGVAESFEAVDAELALLLLDRYKYRCYAYNYFSQKEGNSVGYNT